MASVTTEGEDSTILRSNKLALVERLADDLAHEIKNPLHSMVINLEVLKRRVSRWSGADATELMRYVGILSSELDRVSRRVDLLLRMVRADRGGDAVALGATVEDLLELVELECERHRISIELEPPRYTADAVLPRDVARQIVLNLLLLAIDGASPGGTVRITSSVEGREERLTLEMTPGGEGDRSPADGVSDPHAMQQTATMLVEQFGGHVQVTPAGGSDGGGVIVVTVPLVPA